LKPFSNLTKPALSLSKVSFVIAAFVLLANNLHAQIVDGIIAIVGTKTILLSDVETQSLQYKTEGSDPHAVNCQVLEGLLTQKLLISQALLDSIEVTDDEVEGELDRRIRYFSNMAGGTQKLEEYYGKSIIEIKEEFRTDIREQLLAQKAQQEIVKDIKVTPSEVRTFFSTIPADSLPYYNAEVEVGEIVIIPGVSPEVKALAKEQIDELRGRIIKGEDFSTLAALYSEDPGSRDNGGELGFVNRGELDPAFEAAAFSLKNPGDVSEVVESTFGYHIIQLIERRGERINVRHILITPKTTSFDLNRAVAKADSIHQLVTTNKISFEQAALRYSQNDDSKNNGGMLVNPNTNTTYFDVEQLGQYDPQLALDVQKMDVGGVSEPTMYKTPDGKTRYRILYLKSRTKAHRANLKDDYDKIQSVAQQNKQTQVFNDWLKDKKNKNYVRISSDYVNCDNLKQWINVNNN
jgi:peptidyl-prolyl cis-trans isomerase SurA